MLQPSNTVRDDSGQAEGAAFSAPLAGLGAGRLELSRGALRVSIRGAEDMEDLFRARFEGPVPEVTTEGGTVRIRQRNDWPRLVLQSRHQSADIVLNASIPWEVALRGGVSRLAASLAGMRLTSIEVRGGASHVEVELGRPEAIVPVRVVGGASHVTIWRPAGVPVRATVRGGISRFALDDQRFGAIGGESRLVSGDWQSAGAGYDVEVTGGASHLSIGSR